VALVILIVALLLVAVEVSVRDVHHNGENCGSFVKPRDMLVKGPAGTNPSPCAGTHAAVPDVALALLVVAGLVTVALIRSSSRHTNGERTTGAVPST
jgi:hypothetical protein